jgi:hypothetical protein
VSNRGKVAMFVVERVFDVLEFLVALGDKKKKQAEPSQLSLKDLIELRRQDESQRRRAAAPTVVIPPPSEASRERQRR